MTPAMRLVLFDVDGTLISTDGAGMRAYYRALQSVFDIKAGPGLIRPDGKTDPLIGKELLRCFDMEDRWSDESQQKLFSSYLAHLEDEMTQAKNRGSIRILPGVKKLLEMLSRYPDFLVGLATGNLEKGAHIKLEKAGLRKYFKFGGYGSDSEDRTSLIRVGIQRGIRAIAPSSLRGVFAVGDTPFDIIHGHEAGATVISVASAKYGMDDLRFHNPDLLVPDLAAADLIVSFMRNNAMESGTLDRFHQDI
jgi:phosphoglycolate phosphatase